MHYDVFNGDADGLCALHQWRLVHPADARLVTGAKRDVRLLERVIPKAGDAVTVFDVSLRDNREAAQCVLEAGATLTYFDHHESAELPTSPNLHLRIDTSPDVCTSLLVDREIGGTFRAWAVVAAFGDNLDAVARQAAAPLGLSTDDLEILAELGRLLNYNAYGDDIADLHIHPEALYRAIRPFTDPLACSRDATEVARLRSAFASDSSHLDALKPVHQGASTIAYVLPGEAWARRMHGLFANQLASQYPDRAVAVVVENLDATLRVSVRTPSLRPGGADRLCREFPTGGGRTLAAGISRLPPEQLDLFLMRFDAAFSKS